MNWPTLILGVLIVAGSLMNFFIGPTLYRLDRENRIWMLPRVWPERWDVAITRVVSTFGVAFGMVLVVWATFLH